MMKELYEKAKETVPISPFESRKTTFGIFIATAFSSIFFLELTRSMQKPEVGFFAVCVLLAGCLFDNATTESALALFEEFPELAETGIIESNALLPDVPSKEELYKLRFTAADAALLATTPFYPPIGICFGLYKVMAGLNNVAIEKRLHATLQLASQEEPYVEDEYFEED